MDVYLDSPLTKEYVESVNYLLGQMMDCPNDNPKWCPKSLLGTVLNAILKDLINSTDSSVVKTLRNQELEEFKFIENVAQDIAQQLEHTLTLEGAVPLTYRVENVEFIEGIILLKVETKNEL